MADNSEYVWDEYEESLKMSTYLVAFAVTDFTFKVMYKMISLYF